MTDKTDKDEILIGCMTVKMGLWNPESVVQGCMVKRCEYCGVDIYLSPTSQKFISDKPKSHLACIACIQKKAIEEEAKGDPITFKGAVPGAIKEALGHMLREEEKQ